MADRIYHSDNYVNSVAIPGSMHTYTGRINLPQYGSPVIYPNRPSQPRHHHTHHIQPEINSYTRALLRIPPPDDEPASDESEVEVIEENKMKIENEISMSNEKFDKEMCEINLEEEEEKNEQEDERQSLKKTRRPSVVELTTTIENLIEFGDEPASLVENNFIQFDLLGLNNSDDEDKNSLITLTNNTTNPPQNGNNSNSNPFNTINNANNNSNSNNISNDVFNATNNSHNITNNNNDIFNSTANTNSFNTTNNNDIGTANENNTNNVTNNNIFNSTSNTSSFNTTNTNSTNQNNNNFNDITNNQANSFNSLTNTNPFNSFSSSTGNISNSMFNSNEQIFAAFENYNKTKNIQNDLLGLDVNSTQNIDMSNKTSFSTGNMNQIDPKNSILDSSSSIDDIFKPNLSNTSPDYKQMYETDPNGLKTTLLKLDNLSLSTALYRFMSTDETSYFILSLARDSGTNGTRLLQQIPALPQSSMNDYLESRKNFAVCFPMFEGNFSLYDFTQKNKGKTPPTPGTPPVSVDVAKHLIKDLEQFLKAFADHQNAMVLAEDGYDAFQALSYIIAKLRFFNIQKGFVNSSTIPLYKNLHRRILEAYTRAQLNINFPQEPFNFDDELILKKLRAPKHRDLFEQL